jgi:hypothetical protein
MYPFGNLEIIFFLHREKEKEYCTHTAGARERKIIGILLTSGLNGQGLRA